MLSYQFIKYNNDTSVDHIKKYSETNSIICLDLEDSIINSEQKKYYRNCLINIIENISPKVPEVKIGIRINNDSVELKNDLEILSNRYINTIFFPKIETVEEIKNIQNLFDKKNIVYDEFIPIIETKIALANLNLIIKDLPKKINRLGFGHCDYNLSIGAFPFFHQNSIEYWKWIKKINLIISSKGLSIVNSAYLELENYSFFKSMLHYLYQIFGDDVGQTSLTTKQSEIINNFNPDRNHLSFNELINHRLNIEVPNNYETQIINLFEKENNNKAFSVLKKNKIIISPQEYFFAKTYYQNKHFATINLSFIGGCLPVQSDIVFEDLFHQILKRKIEERFNVVFNIKIIRYEKFNKCIDKIKKNNRLSPADILVFHVRPEPYLRLVKFFYRYLNEEGKIKRSLNIPFLKILNPEKYDLLKHEQKFIFRSVKKETNLHKLLVDLNLWIGVLFGNKNYAIKKYFDFASSIIEYCKNEEINTIVLGMASRDNTRFAPKLCNELNSYFKNKFENLNVPYIESFNRNSGNNQQFIQSNGIHATERYHEFIAEILYDEIKNKVKRILKDKKVI